MHFIRFTIVVLILMTSSSALAEQIGGLMTLDDAGTGNLLIKSMVPGKYVPAPALGTDVHMDITGTINRTRVTQKFQNPSDQWIEAVYAFPLPEGAAVDTLKMIIGDRIIEGKIKEKEEARKTFEAAKQSGQRASLVEQVRPNMFTNEVANIGPFETIIVQIEYQENVRVADGTWSVRFPMVVGARYNPAMPTSAKEPGENLHQFADPVPGRDTLPSLGAYDPNRDNPLSLQVNLDAGMPLRSIETPFHKTDVTTHGERHHRIVLAKGQTRANRDFELIWSPTVDDIPAVVAHRESTEAGDFVLVTMTPPDAARSLMLDRELVLIIDVSGSMSGESIVQAKAGALSALARLKSTDSVNVISFSNFTDILFPKAMVLTADVRRQVAHYIRNLKADAGTVMYPALHAALVDTKNTKSERLRQIVFMTDGSVGNENQLLKLIDQELGDSRLFTVGIGSAPNSYFMTRAATMGRGTFTYIGSIVQVADRMATLFNKLENPAMTDISVSWPKDISVDLAQNIVPDLYAGEPIILAAKLSELSGEIQISGKRGTEEWHHSIPLDPGKNQLDTTVYGIGKLWARHKIAGLEAQHLRGADPQITKRDIARLALTHHLVSRFTSLVAVDVTPARDGNTPLTRKDIPLMIPEGWDMFGTPSPSSTQTMTEPQLMAMIQPQKPANAVQLILPNTATGLWANLLMGLAFMLLGLFFLALTRRRLLAVAGPARAYRR